MQASPNGPNLKWRIRKGKHHPAVPHFLSGPINTSTCKCNTAYPLHLLTIYGNGKSPHASKFWAKVLPKWIQTHHSVWCHPRSLDPKPFAPEQSSRNNTKKKVIKPFIPRDSTRPGHDSNHVYDRGHDVSNIKLNTSTTTSNIFFSFMVNMVRFHPRSRVRHLLTICFQVAWGNTSGRPWWTRWVGEPNQAKRWSIEPCFVQLLKDATTKTIINGTHNFLTGQNYTCEMEWVS